MAMRGVSRRTFLTGASAAVVGGFYAAGAPAGALGQLTRVGVDDEESGLRFLEGNFAPVADELDVTDLRVDGSIPPELDGHLLRVGPNPVAPDPAAYHWFLGDGMVHGIELRAGRASYRNRWVRTDTAAALLGEAAPAGQPAEANLVPNAANTSLVEHGGRVLALYEVSLPTEITLDLDTVGRFDFGGGLRSPMTAHPKVDPATGELLFFGIDIFGPPYLRFHVVDPSGTLVQSHEITLAAPVMMHDFAVTQRHVVFLDLPVVYDFALVGERPLPAAWQPDHGARVGIAPRDAPASVDWIDIEPCFVFHTANAYDDGDRVVLDVVRHERMFDRDPTGFDEGGPLPELERWTIDPGRGRVATEPLADRGEEFPRVDPRAVGRAHRYSYGTLLRSRRHDLQTSGVVKHDLRRGTAETAGVKPGSAWSEAVFVPAAPGAAEDEGWVLGIRYDARRDRSELVILDATDFGGRPVARVRLPRRVPFHFHGIWVPAA